MDHLIQWANNYSAPVAILLAIGAALVFVLRHVVVKAVEVEFERRNKRLELLLQRRSNFEEKVLLDQYQAVTELQWRLGEISANLARLRNGIEVKGLMRGDDIVPLSEVYVEIETKRFLLKEEFHDLLQKEAQNLLAFANAKTPKEASELRREFIQLNEEFNEQMKRSFGIDQITWTTLGAVQRNDG